MVGQEKFPIADELPERFNPSADPRGVRLDPYLELAIAVLLGIAAIMIAIAVYHNERADHEAAVEFTGSIRNATAATGHLAESAQAHAEYRALFVAYAQDLHIGDQTLADYLKDNIMSPRLSSAVGWWRTRADAQPSPFVHEDPFYRKTWAQQQSKKAIKETELADEGVVAGKRQQDRAAHYTRSEVFFTIALVLFGISGVTRHFRIRVSSLGMGAVALLLGSVLLATV
jgi:hypothetical protein